MGGDSKKREIRIGDEYDIPVRVVEFRTMGTVPHIKPWKVQVRGTGPADMTEWVCPATLEASRRVREAPEPLKVGDRVRSRYASGEGTIKGVHEISAWVVWDSPNGQGPIWGIAYLERVE